MNREQIELLFCVLAFAWITYMAIKHKVHQTDRGAFRLILLIFVGLLLAFSLLSDSGWGKIHLCPDWNYPWQRIRLHLLEPHPLGQTMQRAGHRHLSGI